MSEVVYIDDVERTNPPWGSLSNEGAPALIDRAKQYFRDTREDCGLIVRRECSQGQGCRSLRSLPDQRRRGLKHIARC